MAKDNKKKKTCFIITPIGDINTTTRRKIDGLIEEVIKPAIGDRYEILVSHKSVESGSMTRYIIRNVYNCDLAIANLTDQNPNVMYEVALRHACAKPIIHIAEDVTKLPFDISDHRTIPFVDDIFGVGDLKKNLIKMVDEIEQSDGIVSNPIVDNLDVTNIIPTPNVNEVDLVEAVKLLSDKMDGLNEKINNREKHENKGNVQFMDKYSYFASAPYVSSQRICIGDENDNKISSNMNGFDDILYNGNGIKIGK